MVLLKSIQALPYHFGQYAHHPARFVNFGQLAQLCVILIVSLVFPIPLIVSAWMIAQTVSDCIQSRCKHLLRLSSCRSCLSRTFHILLLWLNAVLASWADFRTTVVSLFPWSSICFPFSLLFNQSVFRLFSANATSFIITCAMLPMFGRFLPQRHSWFDSLHDIVVGSQSQFAICACQEW
jgi:hypothetical protein